MTFRFDGRAGWVARLFQLVVRLPGRKPSVRCAAAGQLRRARRNTSAIEGRTAYRAGGPAHQ